MHHTVFLIIHTHCTHISNKDATDAASALLTGPFCFVQTSDGKVVTALYNQDEKPDVVNFKKAIAAAFQANFKKTAQEVEEDAQSRHISQYRSVFAVSACICINLIW